MELIIITLLALVAAQTSFLTVKQVRSGSPRSSQRPIFVDTSVLIDGRIVSVAESGFITGTLSIPRSVVGELQFLADNGDTDKRTRARHGLDVINELQSLATVTTVIFPDSPRAEEGVDNRLLSLAKRYKGVLCTIDYNLNKVAVVEGISVLNVNELAKTLRMAYLPGEKTTIDLIQKGNDSHQAVGHLSDGTMVVVEHASQHIGSSVEVEFIRSLQTAAGKMMFARLVQQPRSTAAPRSPKEAVVHKGTASGPRQKRAAGQPEGVVMKGAQPQSSAQKQPSQPAKSPQQAPRRQSMAVRKNNQSHHQPRRRTVEDDLIELVNRSSS